MEFHPVGICDTLLMTSPSESRLRFYRAQAGRAPHILFMKTQIVSWLKAARMPRPARSFRIAVWPFGVARAKSRFAGSFRRPQVCTGHGKLAIWEKTAAVVLSTFAHPFK